MTRLKSGRPVREVGDAVAVLSNENHNKSSFSSKPGRFRSLSPIPALRRARVFGSCLSESVVKTAARRAADSKPVGAHGEAQVVNAQTMQRLILDFIQKWNSVRPFDPRTLTMSPLDWLAQETGINVRKINGYARCEYSFVGISHAELLLIAMGLSYMLSSDEIAIVKNPYWSWMQYNTWLRSRGVDPNML